MDILTDEQVREWEGILGAHKSRGTEHMVSVPYEEVSKFIATIRLVQSKLDLSNHLHEGRRKTCRQMEALYVRASQENVRLREHLHSIKSYEAELENGEPWDLDCAIEAIQDCVKHATQALMEARK